MKKIAIFGFGNHVKKNILPTFKNLGWVVSYFLVRDLEKYEGNNCCGVVTDNISLVLSDKELDFIYIATPISTHFYFAKIALEHGFDVICEKPITVSAKELFELELIAKKNQCNLQQVTMYKYHNQYLRLKEILSNADYGSLKHVFISFKIPHLSFSDIRYDPSKGGGALYDVGFYPLSAAIDLFDGARLEFSKMSTDVGCEVDLSGMAIFSGRENFIINCQWAIGSCYENKIILDFSEHRVVAERIFSKPSSYDTCLKIYDNSGKEEIISTGKDDQFFNMFSHFSMRTNLSSQVQETISTIEKIRKRGYS